MLQTLKIHENIRILFFYEVLYRFESYPWLVFIEKLFKPVFKKLQAKEVDEKLMKLRKNAMFWQRTVNV